MPENGCLCRGMDAYVREFREELHLVTKLSAWYTVIPIPHNFASSFEPLNTFKFQESSRGHWYHHVT